MTRRIDVMVPLTRQQTLSLLLEAAEALQHRVVSFAAAEGEAVFLVDFSLRALSTFRVHAEARPESAEGTRLSLVVRPGFKLGVFTGVGQSERIGWELIGKMQQIMDPNRYRELEDEVLPSRLDRGRRVAAPPGTEGGGA